MTEGLEIIGRCKHRTNTVFKLENWVKRSQLSTNYFPADIDPKVPKFCTELPELPKTQINKVAALLDYAPRSMTWGESKYIKS